MHLPVGFIVRIFGIVIQRIRQRGEVSVSVDGSGLCQIMVPSLRGGRRTLDTIVDIFAGAEVFTTLQYCLIYLAKLTEAVIEGVFSGDFHIECSDRADGIASQHSQWVIGIGITGSILQHQFSRYRLRIGEIALGGALHFEYIARDKVRRLRSFDIPREFDFSRHAIEGVFQFLRFEIIDAVIRRNIDCIGGEGLGHLCLLIEIHLEFRVESVLHGVLCGDNDGTHLIRGRHLRGIERSVVTDRFLHRGILHRRSSYFRQTVLVHHVDIRGVQLRRNRYIAALKHIRPADLLVLYDRPWIFLTDGSLHPDGKFLSLQFGIRIPVEGDIGDALVSVIVFALEFQRRLPIGGVIGRQRHRFPAVGTPDDGAAFVNKHISFAFRTVCIVRTVLHRI